MAIYTSNWKYIVELWYREVKYFTYNQTPHNFFDIGHYTQVSKKNEFIFKHSESSVFVQQFLFIKLKIHFRIYDGH